MEHPIFLAWAGRVVKLRTTRYIQLQSEGRSANRAVRTGRRLFEQAIFSRTGSNCLATMTDTAGPKRDGRSVRALAALVLVLPCLASGCLQPGSLEDQELYRLDKPETSTQPPSDAASESVTDSGTEPDTTRPPPDGGTEPDVTEPPGVTIWIEAESDTTLSAPLMVSDDTTASGGKFISVTNPTEPRNDAPDETTMGIANYTFSPSEDGTFTIFGRVRAPTTDNDSFWVKIDQGAWVQWNNLTPSTDWVWDDVHDATQANTTLRYTLSQGDHTLAVAYREQGTELDKFVITSVVDFVPTGIGE
jgi:hypothetical protein